MIRGILQFALHARQIIALSKRLSQPELYDNLMLKAEKLGLGQWRSSLVKDLEGDILEIGCGTGLMFPHYKRNVRLVATEFASDFLELAKARTATMTEGLTLTLSDGQQLPFNSETFDCVVIALVLCTAPVPELVIAETKRVLKRGGQIRLIEHVRSPRGISGFLMKTFNSLWLGLNKHGCNMHRLIDAVLEQSGISLEEVRPFKVRVPGMPAFPMRWIKARPMEG